jgi:hypothetical protein
MATTSPAAAFAAIALRIGENDVPMNVAADIDQIMTEIAGHGMPVDVVSTEAEYGALPIGSIVRSTRHGEVAERVDENDEGYRWVYTGSPEGAFQHETIARNLGEATVLFTP